VHALSQRPEGEVKYSITENQILSIVLLPNSLVESLPDESLDFTKSKMDDNIVEKFVTQIIPLDNCSEMVK
jgi:hypothetical protein